MLAAIKHANSTFTRLYVATELHNAVSLQTIFKQLSLFAGAWQTAVLYRQRTVTMHEHFSSNEIHR